MDLNPGDVQNRRIAGHAARDFITPVSCSTKKLGQTGYPIGVPVARSFAVSKGRAIAQQPVSTLAALRSRSAP
jgi:hypothetical protein